MVNYCVCSIYIRISLFLCNIRLIVSGTLLPSASEPTYSKSGRNKNNNRIAETSTISSAESRKNKRNRKEKERVSDVENVPVSVATSMSLNATTTSNHLAGQNDNVGRRKKGDNSASSAFGSGILEYFINLSMGRG